MTTSRKPLSFDVERTSVPKALAPAAAPPSQVRQQVGARVPASTYRQLKARAALQGVTVQTLVEQAIDEFLAKHSD